MMKTLHSGILSWNLPDTTPHEVNVTSWPRSTTSQLVRLSVDESNAVRKGVEIVQLVMIRAKLLTATTTMLSNLLTST